MNIFKRTTFTSVAASALLLLSFSSSAAISIGGTRVIYNENSKVTPVNVHNTDDDSIYLIRSWIEKGTHKNIPFIITPPLFRINSGEDNSIRISKTDTSALPQDRESLFWLNIMAVPPQASVEGKGSLQFSLNTKIKLIYRPDSINNKTDVASSYQKLQFSRTSSGVVINNPTPYYINISKLKFDNVEIKQKAITVPPKGTFTIKQNVNKDISWTAINDYGGITKIASTTL